MADGHVDRVNVTTTRSDVSGAVFSGWNPKDVISRMSRIYSLCGIAQTVAACASVEDAQDLRAGPPLVAARDALRLSEMLTQTAMRLCLHWPKALNMGPLPAPVQASMAVQSALSWVFAGALSESAANAADPDMSQLSQKIDLLSQAIDKLHQTGGLRDQLRDALVDRGWQGFGALPPNATPEQGALNRRWNDPTVAAARQVFGAGLLARLEAGFCDLAALLDEMRVALSMTSPGVVAPALSDLDGTGRAVVETARGALSHSVTIRQGRIALYQIAAPTEANFAPGGPVESGLLGALDEPELETAARLHVLAIDPCVEFTLGLQHA